MAIASFKLTGSNPVATVDGFVAVITTADFLNANADCLDGTKFTGGNLIVYADAAKTTRYPIHVVKSVTGVSPDFLVYVRIPTYASAESIWLEADDVQTTQPVPSGTYGQYAAYQDIIGALHFENTSTGSSDVISVTPTIAGTSAGLPTNTTGQYGDNAWAFNGIDQDAGVSNPCGLDVIQPWTIKSNVKFDVVAGTVWEFYNTAEDEYLTLKIKSGNWKITTAGLTPGDAGFGPTIGQWHTTHMVWDSSKLYLYIDGVLAYSITPSLSVWQDRGGGFRIASSKITTDFLDGAISEFYTKQSAMSVEEIALEHANRSNPGTFWTASDASSGTDPVDIQLNSIDIQPHGIFLTEKIKLSQQIKEKNIVPVVSILTDHQLLINTYLSAVEIISLSAFDISGVSTSSELLPNNIFSQATLETSQLGITNNNDLSAVEIISLSTFDISGVSTSSELLSNNIFSQATLETSQLGIANNKDLSAVEIKSLSFFQSKDMPIFNIGELYINVDALRLTSKTNVLKLTSKTKKYFLKG